MTSYILIDPQVSPYSTPEQLQKWLSELQAMDQSNEQVRDAIKQAKKWLENAQKHKKWEP